MMEHAGSNHRLTHQEPAVSSQEEDMSSNSTSIAAAITALDNKIEYVTRTLAHVDVTLSGVSVPEYDGMQYPIVRIWATMSNGKQLPFEFHLNEKSAGFNKAQMIKLGLDATQLLAIAESKDIGSAKGRVVKDVRTASYKTAAGVTKRRWTLQPVK